MTDIQVELETLRRQRDWSYRELADEIAEVTKRRRNQDCWRRICQGQTETPNARTLAILDAFLAAIDAPKPRQRRTA